MYSAGIYVFIESSVLIKSSLSYNSLESCTHLLPELQELELDLQ